MKINRNTKSETAANEILAFFRDDESADGRQDPVVSVSEDGDLMFYNAACGTDETETVLVERLEGDSFGVGWDAAEATTSELMDWIETNCKA